MRTKSIAQGDFHFLIGAFVAQLLEINKILDRPIIRLAWNILNQLFTSLTVKVVDIYFHFGE